MIPKWRRKQISSLINSLDNRDIDRLALIVATTGVEFEVCWTYIDQIFADYMQVRVRDSLKRMVEKGIIEHVDDRESELSTSVYRLCLLTEDEWYEFVSGEPVFGDEEEDE